MADGTVYEQRENTYNQYGAWVKTIITTFEDDAG